MIKRCGWLGTLSDFLYLDEQEFVNNLQGFIPDAKENQIRAWRDCYHVLKDQLLPFRQHDWQLIFEYELPREGGRRPDVLLLLPGQIIVLEFKMAQQAKDVDFEQLSSYIRDLSSYHSTVIKHSLKLRGALIITGNQNESCIAHNDRALYECARSGLHKLLYRASNHLKGDFISAHIFLQGHYEPLPTIAQAARLIMNNDPLPQIRTVQSTNIPEALDTIRLVVKEAKRSLTRHLVLVSGVPGAGKTLIGLVLSHELDQTVYLSGNRPLVDVLQDALGGNKIFVQPLLYYKREYSNMSNIPNEHVFIFDEAQRAWDKNRMKKNYSEPDLLVKIAGNKKNWSVIIGLIGEGQEIHKGEETGLPLWNEAIKGGDWTVHSSKPNHQLFSNAIQHVQHNHLHLNASLRSHTAHTYHEWVKNVLDGREQQLFEKTKKLRLNHYTLYITRDLSKACNFAQEKYKEESLKNYGLIASSKRSTNGINVVQGLPQTERYNTKPYVAYFNHPESEYHCTTLRYAATEFDTQGLELDLAIVCWGYDLRWNGQQWINYFNDLSVQDAKQLRLNSYRVLLTRGRDGTIIYIPDHPILDDTYHFFKEIGINDIII